MSKFFSFDGCSFETHETEEEARTRAEEAMQSWSDDACGYGWDECADQVCYGKITHAVRVETTEINDENRHTVMTPNATSIEEHFLEPVEEPKQ